MNANDTRIACQGCPEESVYAAHGIREGEIYDEHWCDACWNKKDRTVPDEGDHDQ